MAKDWFYSKNGQRLGPVSESILRSLVAGNEISTCDLVWTDGMKEWKEARVILELATPQNLQSGQPVVSLPPSNSNSPNVTVVSNSQPAISRTESFHRWNNALVAIIGTLVMLILIGSGAIRGYLSWARQKAGGAEGVALSNNASVNAEVGPNVGNSGVDASTNDNVVKASEQEQESASPIESAEPKAANHEKDAAKPKAIELQPETDTKAESTIEPGVTDYERVVAEWVLRVGGSLLVQDASGAELTIRSNSNLPFGSLTILKIDLTGVKEVSNGDLQKLKDAPQLVYLSVMSTSVSDEGLSHLQAVQSLEELNIAGTSITGAGFRYLNGLPNLRTLNCGGSPISDESLENLSNLQLVSLGLIDTKVTTEGAKYLKAMPTLKRLRLSGTGFTDQGLKQLNRLTALEMLMIDRTKITEAGMRSFKAAVPACSVRYTSKAGVTLNERGVAKGSQAKGNETSVTESSFVGKYQIAIVNVENGRVQKALQVEIKDDKSLLVSDGTKGEWSVRNKRLVVKAEALFGGLILTKQQDGSLMGEMVYAADKMRYRMKLTPVSP